MNPPESFSKIDEEASLWAARLANGAQNPDIQAGLARWLSADPAHAPALERYRQTDSRIDLHVEAHLAAMLEISIRKRRKKSRRLLLSFGTLAVAALIVFLFNIFTTGTSFATGLGERRTLVLDDGSKIDLNACTEIKVSYESTRRSVQLMRGEAFFNVTKNTARPFIVKTASGEIKVTGTLFNVRGQHDGTADVTVLEGSVLVQPGSELDQARAVSAGYKARLDSSSVSIVSVPVTAMQDLLAWKQGQLVLDATPLSEAIERFAAYHPLKLTVDPQVAGLKLGGRFSLDDLEGFLASVEAVLPVSVRRLDGEAIALLPVP